MSSQIELSLKEEVDKILRSDDYDVTANKERYFLINRLRAVESDPELLDITSRLSSELVDGLLAFYLTFDESRISDTIARSLLEYADIEQTRALLVNEACGPCHGLSRLKELLK